MLSGHGTADQVQKVADVYVKYQAASALAQMAIISYSSNTNTDGLTKAIATVSESSSALTTLITKFTGK